MPSVEPAPTDATPASDGHSPQTDAAGESPAKKLKAEAAQVKTLVGLRYLLLLGLGLDCSALLGL